MARRAPRPILGGQMKERPKSLSRDDREALRLLAEASAQLEIYQELSRISALVPQIEEPVEPTRTWDFPLTLVMRPQH